MTIFFTPGANEPGECQICGRFRVLHQHFPSTLPARFVEICEECAQLSDLEIARRLPGWRRDGAQV